MTNFDGYTESTSTTKARAARTKAWAEQNRLCYAIVKDCTAQVAHFTSAIAGAYIVDGEHPVDEAQAIERKIDARLAMVNLTTDPRTADEIGRDADWLDLKNTTSTL